MKFALIDGKKNEAIKGAKGLCPICGSDLIAKCGELKINHWAHKGNRNCDPWWENETDWHRSWKEKFPVDWQEVVHVAINGEKHIADVKTENGWVIEFQHSYLNPEERRARNAFYSKLIWIVDGTRRKRDIEQFSKTINRSTVLDAKSKICRVHSHDCMLLKEWVDSHTPVLFDFGGNQLWWLLEGVSNDVVYVAPIPREYFIEVHCGGEKQKYEGFNKFASDISKLIIDYESSLHSYKNKRNYGSKKNRF